MASSDSASSGSANSGSTSSDSKNSDSKSYESASSDSADSTSSESSGGNLASRRKKFRSGKVGSSESSGGNGNSEMEKWKWKWKGKKLRSGGKVGSVDRIESSGGNSNSKRLKVRSQHKVRGQQVDSVDRISNLPNSILLHILSFLPTKNVVQTGILSTRWENLWVNVPSLNFKEGNIAGATDEKKDETMMTFTNFVNRVLLEYRPKSIQKFRIECRSNPVEVESWIKKAISLNVQELDVTLSPTQTEIATPIYQLPRSIFTCKTLVVLKLTKEITIVVPSSACFPNLKTLELLSVTYQDVESASKLISCCLVLENLYIMRRKFDNVERFRISAQALKSLTIDVDLCDDEYFEDYECVLDINTPALQNLDIRDNNSESFLFTNFGSLNQASLDFSLFGSCQSLIKCFEAFNNVKFLSLYGDSSTPLNLEPGLLSAKFSNLTHFTVEDRSVWLPTLRYFLECFENLEVLTIAQDSYARSDDDNIWIEPDHVPRCLLSCLREIRFDDFHETENQLDMLKYMLKNGKVLETVDMHYTCERHEPRTYDHKRGKAYELEKQLHETENKSLTFEEKFCLVQKIVKFPRGSKTCGIAFSS